MAVEFQPPRVATATNPLRIGVLISGSGSGLAALLEHQKRARAVDSGTHVTELIIADGDAPGLQHGLSAGIPSLTIALPDAEPHIIEADDRNEGLSRRRRSHEEMVHAALIASDVELVILSGYMRIVSPGFVKHWKGRLLNIHPSLLPDFPGAHAHRDVLAAGVEVTGCTVHFVDEGVDSGPIAAQLEVEVHPDDDETSLSERVKQVEHLLYPTVIDALSNGDMKIDAIGTVTGSL